MFSNRRLQNSLQVLSSDLSVTFNWTGPTSLAHRIYHPSYGRSASSHPHLQFDFIFSASNPVEAGTVFQHCIALRHAACSVFAVQIVVSASIIYYRCSTETIVILHSDLLPFVTSNLGMFREHASFFATTHYVLNLLFLSNGCDSDPRRRDFVHQMYAWHFSVLVGHDGVCIYNIAPTLSYKLATSAVFTLTPSPVAYPESCRGHSIRMFV